MENLQESVKNHCEPRVLRLIHKNHLYTGFSKNQRAYTLFYKKVVDKKVLLDRPKHSKNYSINKKKQESFKKVLVVEFTENFKKV